MRHGSRARSTATSRRLPACHISEWRRLCSAVDLRRETTAKLLVVMSEGKSHDEQIAATTLRRLWLTLAMTREYQGRFPRRKVWRLYWRQAGRPWRHG